MTPNYAVAVHAEHVDTVVRLTLSAEELATITTFVQRVNEEAHTIHHPRITIHAI